MKFLALNQQTPPQSPGKLSENERRLLDLTPVPGYALVSRQAFQELLSSQKSAQRKSEPVKSL